MLCVVGGHVAGVQLKVFLVQIDAVLSFGISNDIAVVVSLRASCVLWVIGGHVVGVQLKCSLVSASD